MALHELGLGLPWLREARQSMSHRLLAAGIVLLLSLSMVPVVTAGWQEPRARDNSGGFVTVRSPITSATVHAVKRQTEALLAAGARIIVFEIQPGTSDYGNCLNLAHYVEGVAGAKTVAFVREPLAGHAVMVALAADELVVSRKAELGDIGRDEKLVRPGMISEYDELATRRKPAHRAIILGMLDKKYQVWKVVTARDTRYVLDEDLKKLDAEEQIRSREVLIMAGQWGNFTGLQLRQLGLAQLNAETRSQVAELYGMPAKSAIESAQTEVEWKPVLIRIQDEISPLLREYVERHVKDAWGRGHNLFIFEIDSPGGDAAAGLQLGEFIKDMKGVKTLAYIPRNAISAAAFIALGCDEILMHPDAKLGDCGTMFMDPGGQFHYVPDKILSILSTSLRALAEAKGYPPALARAMIEKDLVVREVQEKRTGRVLYLSDDEIQQRDPGSVEVRRTVKNKDEFLTVLGRDAVGLDLANDLVDNLDGLKALYGLEEKDLTIVSPTWVDTLISRLNSPFVSMLLIVVGILALYTELKMPGVLIPGLVAGLCFLLFFWSHVMGGTATALEVVLFLAGVLCLGLEILVIPGFGVVGVTGILLMIFSLVLASQTFVFPQTTSQWKEFTLSMMPLLTAFVSLSVFAFLLSKYLPQVPVLGRMVLQPTPSPGDDYAKVEPSSYQRLLGCTGVAMTKLRPAGLVQFGDQYIDVVTEGVFVEEGTRVQVIEVTGNRILVKQVS